MDMKTFEPPETSQTPAATRASVELPQADAGATRTLRRAGIVALALIVIAALAGWLPRARQQAALRAESARLSLLTVKLVSPAPAKTAPALVLPAEIKPLVEAPIYARASGYLKSWMVDIGAQVKEGDLLAEIDTPELDQELAQGRAQVTEAEAAVALAKITASRWTDLAKTASVSQQEAVEKQSDLDLKTATLEAARANVRRLEQLQSFQKVTAPFAGTVTVRNTDVGQLISATNGRELFRLAQTSRLRVYVRVPQTAARGVSVGQNAELIIPELASRKVPARVVRTSGALTPDSRTLLTELEVDNASGEILAGTYAQVRLNESRLTPPLTLPASAVMFRGEGAQIGVVDSASQVQLRPVTVGRDLGSEIEVLEGVSTGDRVILNPPDSLSPGQKVQIAAG
jgi:RND family efflux transporter MFP subunit